MQDLEGGTLAYVGEIEQDTGVLPTVVFTWKLEVVSRALTSQPATISLVEDLGTWIDFTAEKILILVQQELEETITPMALPMSSILPTFSQRSLARRMFFN